MIRMVPSKKLVVVLLLLTFASAANFSESRKPVKQDRFLCQHLFLTLWNMSLSMPFRAAPPSLPKNSSVDGANVEELILESLICSGVHSSMCVVENTMVLTTIFVLPFPVDL